MDIDKLNMAIMNIPCKKTLSHFATVSEAQAYKLGHRDARHAAVEILLEHFKDDAEPSVATGERALFETWASGGGRAKMECWYAWQARAALASPAVSQQTASDELRAFVKKIADLPDTELEGPLAPELKYLRKDARKILAPVTQQAGSQMDGARKFVCQHCGGTDGHHEYVRTGDLESDGGWEIWFCCHRCRDACEPCETFHRIAKGGSPTAATTASASDFNICYEAGVRCQCKDGEEICLRNRRAQASNRENAKAVQVFTCIGKGGEYEVIGYSNGAGPKRGESIIVYYDVTKPDILYHRSADDFKVRMQWQGTRASHAANAGEADVQPGVEFAAKFIEKRAEDYARENSSMEHDTGATVWHYGTAGFDYHCTLIELAEDLRAAIASSAAQEGK
jgi:hypothetical protein